MGSLIEAAVGAIIAWVVPKVLDSLLNRGKQESRISQDLASAFPWMQWCLAHAVAGAIGGFLSGLLGVAGLNTPGGVGNWTVFGVCIGIAQWMVLKRYGGFGPFWAVACALGWSAWSFFQAAQAHPALGWSAVGLIIGILQWVVLLRHRNRAFLWIPANIFAWLIAGTLGYAVGLALVAMQIPFAAAWVVGWGAVGLIGSVILAFALRWMPTRTATDSSE